jgi:predicted acyltransferase
VSALPQPAGKRRVESIDAFRGLTILGMIFVIQAAGYKHLPPTFPHFGSAPVSEWKHAGEDNHPAEWAYWEGLDPAKQESTAFRQAKVRERASDGTYTVDMLDENSTTQTFSGVRIPYAKRLLSGETVIARRLPGKSRSDGPMWSPAAGDVSFSGVGNGCTFTDLVAPFFVFIVGMCLPLSKKGRAQGWWRHALARTGLLILAGVVYISLILKLSWWWGILQAIGIAYLMGAAAMQFPIAARWVLIVALAAFHAWASRVIPWWVHVGPLEGKAWTIANTGGNPLLPLNVHCTPWASIGYGIITLVGTLLGEKVATRDPRTIIRECLILGVVFTVGGYLWHEFQAPMNKDYVSSSYALFTAGQGALWFLAFYLLIDVAGTRGWYWPLAVFGSNALLAYFMQPVVRIFMNALGVLPFFQGHSGWAGILWGLVWTLVLWLVVLVFNRRSIYWKL